MDQIIITQLQMKMDTEWEKEAFQLCIRFVLIIEYEGDLQRLLHKFVTAAQNMT